MNNHGITSQIPNAFANLQEPQSTQSLTVVNNNSKVLPIFLARFINTDLVEKIINVSLYQADFSSLSAKSVDIVKFMHKFLKDSQVEVKKCQQSHFNIPKNILISSIDIANQVLELREDSSTRLITYDNVLQHFPKRDLTTEKLLKSVSSNRILNIDQFRSIFDIIVQTMQAFNETMAMKKTLISWDVFLNETNNEKGSVLNILKNYRDLIAGSYNDLSSLVTVTKREELQDYMILSDQTSTKKVVKNLVTFLSSGYSFYKSGYSLIDDSIGGLESSTFHLITGPSNHAKSIFMINICRNLVLYNAANFKDDDCIVFITLEDDAYKLIRRFISIFGNIDTEVVRRFFIKASSLFKKYDVNHTQGNTAFSTEVSKILTELLTETVISVTGKRCQIILKHCNENSFSPTDATKFVDMLHLEGFKVKALLIDYIDVMVPSNLRYSNYNDYDAQGIIVQELRLASRIYTIPIISITQNTRGAENMSTQMDNSLIGDSYKKIRYSDYVYMVRMRSDLELLHETVKKDICDSTQMDKVSLVDISGTLTQYCVPFEIKITKAKEGKKNAVKYHLFSGINLKIYNNLSEFFLDIPGYKTSSAKLKNSTDLLGMNIAQNLGGNASQSFEMVI